MSAHRYAREVTTAVAAVAFVGHMSVALPALALSPTDTSCHSHLYAGVAKLARDGVRQLGTCHLRRLGGRVSAGTECNSFANAPSQRLLARDAASLSSRARKRCDTPGDASPPALLGFATCPGPCALDVPAINAYADVADCLSCLAADTIEGLGAAAFGTPPAPNERRCFSKIVRAARVYLAAQMREQRACQQVQDSAGGSVDCRTADPNGRVARARVRFDATVAACDPTQLAALGLCGASVSAAQTCLTAAVDTAASLLFAAVYDQTSFGTPTPTESPTLTLTPTRTPTPTLSWTPTLTSVASNTPLPSLTRTPTITPTPRPLTCGNGVLDAGEDCDDGGICAGGLNAGTACDAEGDCVGPGTCIGGTRNLSGCLDDADCPAGQCVHCKPVGGDGCAANCTTETSLAFNFVPGQINPDMISLAPGTSGRVIFGSFLTVPLPMTGSMTLTVGTADPSTDEIPFVLPAAGVSIPRIPISTIACACLRADTIMTCGGVLFDENGDAAGDCTPGFESPVVCPVDRPCAPLHGPGNTGSGVIGCSGLSSIDVTRIHDCNGTAGDDPFDPVITYSGNGGPGSGIMVASLAQGLAIGLCSGTDPSYGADQQFCTSDDPATSRGTPAAFHFTTGTATGTVLNPADFEGDMLGPISRVGVAFTCVGETVADVSGVNLAGTTTECDRPTLNDIVSAINFVAQ